MNKYKISEEIFTKMSRDLPRGIQFGYQDGQNYYIEESYVLSLQRSGFSLQSMAQTYFGVSLETLLNPLRIKSYKIYQFVRDSEKIDHHQAPIDLDFTTQLTVQLHKKLLPKIQGKPTSAIYYEKKYILIQNGSPVLDPFGNPVVVYENPICKIDFQFTFDSFGFIVQRKEWLQWYYTDNTLSLVKKDIGRIFDPILDYEYRIQEGKDRRESIVNGLQLPAFSALKVFYPSKTAIELLSIGREFLSRLDVDFRNFIESSLSVVDPQSPNYGKKVIVVKIQQATDEWLDAPLVGTGITIRQYMISELST